MHLSTDGTRAGSDPGPTPGAGTSGAEVARALQRHRLTLRWSALALGCTVLLGVLLALVESHWGPLARADQGWTDGLHRFARVHTAWTASMQTLTDIGGPVTMRSLLAVAAVWLWAIGARMLAGWVAAQALVGWLAESAGKAAVGRARPHFTDPMSQASGASFPSGHALAAAITCATLVVLVWPQANRAGRAVACTVAALAILTVGWTRVALGVHWPSDVVAGWLTAGVVLGGVTVLAELWRPGALARDVRLVNWRTRPRVQRVLVSGGDVDPDDQ
ncbi:phosphatase PAP2 family protein [Kitasatospora sp. MAP5-34]|uniref:phosphatase PAP2 family protein n=1 Tax=Kitasatospora sp. MAP5-34 TaxID=3035102 RepID=UPI0024743301|nr:phosphatase PAP2 family protein [Kitasatospora sp. MAP5-34]MDH6577053.1 membrane-associated phospholipid phosphatase [Kitasatospora sp. MAP5-34]